MVLTGKYFYLGSAYIYGLRYERGPFRFRSAAFTDGELVQNYSRSPSTDSYMISAILTGREDCVNGLFSIVIMGYIW